MGVEKNSKMAASLFTFIGEPAAAQTGSVVFCLFSLFFFFKVLFYCIFTVAFCFI